MTGQRDLPLGDRDEPGETPRAGELPSTFVERVAERDYAQPAPEDRRTCVCKSRGWVEQHEPPYAERLDAIFRKGPREAGEEG